jgi:hypothetical protein
MNYFIWWIGLITVALALTYVEFQLVDWWSNRKGEE